MKSHAIGIYVIKKDSTIYMQWGIVNLFEKYKDDLLEKEKLKI